MLPLFLLLSISFLSFKGMEREVLIPKINSSHKEKIAGKIHPIAKPLYNIKIDYNWNKQLLRCKVNVKADSFFIKESSLWFELPANGLKSARTLFASVNKLGKENFTGFQFDKISVNGKTPDARYSVLFKGFNADSTLLRINTPGNTGVPLNVSFEYSLKVPRGDFIFGVSEKNDFSVLRGFYPVLLSPNSKILNLPPNGVVDFPPADFSVTVKIPENIKVLNPEFSRSSSGVLSPKMKNRKETILFFSGKSEEIIKDSLNLKDFEVNIFCESSSENYIPRIKRAVLNASKFLEENIGLSLNGNFMIVDLPRSLRLNNFYSSGVAAFHINLFSPVWTKHPEADVIKGLISRLSDGDFLTDFARSPWLFYGVGEYLTNEIFADSYGKLSQSFKLLSYLPIKGETMFAYNEIPIIYRLNSFEYEPWKELLPEYLSTENKTGFSDIDNVLFSRKDFDFVSTVKPALVLQTLKNFYGADSVNSILSGFFKLTRKMGIMNKAVFDSSVINSLGKNGSSIWRALSNSSGNIDYAIAGLTKLYGGVYSLRLSRIGEIALPEKVSVYTDKDTLNFLWDGKSRIKEIVFSSNNKVIGAEIDPQNRNILDVNRADNSYLIEGNYSTAFAYAIHWFFWVQNALMMFGVFG